MELDDEVCLCFHVTARKLIHFVRREQPRHAAQLSECLGAGTGCGWCRPWLVQLFESCRHDPLPEIRAWPAAYADQRTAYLRAGKGQPPPPVVPASPESPAD